MDIEFTTTVALTECERRLKEIGAKVSRSVGSGAPEIGFRWYGDLKKTNYFGFLFNGSALDGKLKVSSSRVLVVASFWPPYLSPRASIAIYAIALVFFLIKWVVLDNGSGWSIIILAFIFGIGELWHWWLYRRLHLRWMKLAALLKETLLAPTYVPTDKNGADLVWTATDSVRLVLSGVGMAIVFALLSMAILVGGAYLLSIFVRLKAVILP